VPRRLLVPTWRSSLVATPQLKSISQVCSSTPDLDVELLREGVDAADTHAVQTARNLVVGRIELAPALSLVRTT